LQCEKNIELLVAQIVHFSTTTTTPTLRMMQDAYTSFFYDDDADAYTSPGLWPTGVSHACGPQAWRMNDTPGTT
jgi:hypothetical protein